MHGQRRCRDSPRLDVIAIGDAIVNVIAACDDAFLAARGLAKGGMRLLDPSEADDLYAAMAPGRTLLRADPSRKRAFSTLAPVTTSPPTDSTARPT